MTEQSKTKLNIKDIDWANLTSDDIIYGYGNHPEIYRGKKGSNGLGQLADPYGFSRDALMAFKGEDCFSEMLNKYIELKKYDNASLDGTVAEYVAFEKMCYSTLLEIADYVKEQADKLIPEVKMRIRLNRKIKRQTKDPDVRAVTKYEITMDKAKLKIYKKTVPKLYKIDYMLYPQIIEAYVPALEELAKKYDGDESFKEVEDEFTALRVSCLRYDAYKF